MSNVHRGTIVTNIERPSIDTSTIRLASISNEAEVLAGLRDDSNTWGWIVVPRIRRLLDLSIDLLAEAAHDVDETDEPRARRLLAARDDIAAHLRAADHLAAAKARPSTHTNLLVRAVERLAEEFGRAA